MTGGRAAFAAVLGSCLAVQAATPFASLSGRFDAALAAERSGRHAQAAAQFRALRQGAGAGWLASYSYLFEGRSLMAGGDTAGALRTWDTLDHKGGQRPEAQLARQYILEARTARGEHEWIDSLLPRGLTRTAGIRALVGRVEQCSRRGERARANEAFAQLLAMSPGSQEMQRAISALERGTSIQDPAILWALARWYYGQNNMSACLRRLDAMPASSVTPAVLELRGRVLLKQGKSPEAEAVFRREGDRGDGQLWLSRALQAQGKNTAAREVQEAYAKDHPASAKGQEIYWSRGLEEEQKGNWDAAVAYLRKVAEAKGVRSAWARMRIGYVWYKAGQWERAIPLLAAEAGGNDASSEAAAWFEGRAYQRLGKESEARAIFARLAKDRPWSFHGHLARRALGRSDEAVRDSLARVSDALYAMGGSASFSRDDSGRVVRALWADHAGFGWMSRQELSAVDRDMRSTASRQRFCLLLESVGLKSSAQTRWRRLVAGLPANSLATAPKGLLKRAFPMPWRAQAEAACGKNTLITPAFVHAVMRQESGFNTSAQSPVGALGLLQLMPATGRAMARRAGMANFKTSDLLNPETNIKLGVIYLRDIARAWSGRTALVAANYNAGPLPCQDWKAAFDTKPLEEAVEEITFWETRDYVKRVMGNWWTYQVLWGEP